MPPTVAGSSNALNSHVLSASANVEQLWQYCSAGDKLAADRIYLPLGLHSFHSKVGIS